MWEKQQVEALSEIARAINRFCDIAERHIEQGKPLIQATVRQINASVKTMKDLAKEK